jgi:hypothetical protein
MAATQWDRVTASEASIGCDRELCETPINVGDRLNLDPKTGKCYHVVSEGRCTGFTTKELQAIGTEYVRAVRSGGELPTVKAGWVAPAPVDTDATAALMAEIERLRAMVGTTPDVTTPAVKPTRAVTSRGKAKATPAKA